MGHATDMHVRPLESADQLCAGLIKCMLSGAENYPIQSNAPVNHAALYNVCTMFNA